MKRVSVYKLTDGSLVEDPALAREMQLKLHVKERLSKFVDEHFISEDVRKLVLDVLCENAPLLRKIYNNDFPKIAEEKAT